MPTPSLSPTTELKADASAQRSAAAAPKVQTPASPVMQAMSRLQRTVGNRGMHRLLSPPAGGVVQRKCVECGLPGSLRAGLEQLSGFDLSGVRVHTNSPRPAEIDALAYAQGTDIHLGPGQERHLPHEGWHVVQQMQGRVAATRQAKGDVSLNDDQELEREADDMGARARQMANEADESETAFQTNLTTEGGGTVVDEVPYATTTRHVGNGVVQRTATFTAGTVTSTSNLAADFMAGVLRAGFTPPTLNGSTIMSGADARTAIDKPKLTAKANADGKSTNVSIDTMPTNTGSYTMQLPSAGPWSTATTKANVAALFTSLRFATIPAGCTGADATTFTVNGKPTNADFVKNVRTHENLHAADHKAGFTTVMVDWDKKLAALKKAGKVFNAKTQADAEKALWTAAGGSPNDIADKQNAEWIRLNGETHKGATLATGASATPSNATANAKCTTSSMDVT